jgi:hypothetical protein
VRYFLDGFFARRKRRNFRQTRTPLSQQPRTKRNQSVAQNLIGVVDFSMHTPQLLTRTHILRAGDEVQVGGQSFECAERLPQLMRKIRQNIFTTR